MHTRAYQRSSLLPEGVDTVAVTRFRTALERRLSPEVLLDSILEATEERERIQKSTDAKANYDAYRARFLKAFAAQPREAETEIEPALRSALFLLNDPLLLDLLRERPNNLVGRLCRESVPAKLTDELYLAVLSRRPTDTERQQVQQFLSRPAPDRAKAIGQLAWALLASMEFNVQH